MAISRVLWIGARKRFWRRTGSLLLALWLAVLWHGWSTQVPPLLALSGWFVLFGTLLYQSYVLVVICGMVFSLKPESRRKLAHLVGGIGPVAAAAVTGSTGLTVSLCCLLLAWLGATRSLSSMKVFRQLSLDRRDGTRSWGDLLLPIGLGSTALPLGVASEPWLAAALTLVLADSAAAVVGTRWGAYRYRLLAGTKSLEGSVAFLICTCACLAVATRLVDATWSPLACIGIAAIVTLVEAGCGAGSDNLLVPWATALALALPIDWTLARAGAAWLVMVFVFAAAVAVQQRKAASDRNPVVER